MSVRTVEQKITAGSNFDGTAPAGQVTRELDMERFPAGAAGGLFDFSNPNPLGIHQVVVKLGGQTSWSLSLVDVDNVEVTLVSGTTETEFISGAEIGSLAKFIVLEGQKLKLVTAGATTAMVARISVDQYRS